MSEIKFKSYDELEIVETLPDGAHVLVEENGEVKRSPANGLGSGGGGGGHWIINSSDATGCDFTLSDGLYESLVEMYANGIPVSVTCFVPNSSAYYTFCKAYRIEDYSVDYTYYANGNKEEIGYVLTSGSRHWHIRHDGNHWYKWDDYID